MVSSESLVLSPLHPRRTVLSPSRPSSCSSSIRNAGSWTALTEIAICGVKAESNALFGGLRTAKKEIAELAGSVCTSCDKLLEPVFADASASDATDDVRYLFDDNFETRWSTERTTAENDLDNAKVTLNFGGDVHVCHANLAFFDGDLARQEISLYKQSAVAHKWTQIGESIVAEKHSAFQKIEIQETGVNKLYIVAHGNEIGDYTKISEAQFWGC